MVAGCVCRWVEGVDALPCGQPHSGRNPSPVTVERGCVDPNGMRRSGVWREADDASTWQRRGGEEHAAFGEWIMMDPTDEPQPVSGNATWLVPDVRHVDRAVAGEWRDVAKPPAELLARDAALDAEARADLETWATLRPAT